MCLSFDTSPLFYTFLFITLTILNIRLLCTFLHVWHAIGIPKHDEIIVSI